MNSTVGEHERAKMSARFDAEQQMSTGLAISLPGAASPNDNS